MNEPNSKIPEDMVDEVLQVASELYAKAEDSYSVSDLKAAGQDVNIPPEIIEQAIEQVREKRRLETIEKQEEAEKKRKLGYVAIGVGALSLLWGILTYNSLSAARGQMNSQWAQVENQLQRKADLIPQLISLTQAQTKQETSIIKQLNQAKNNFQKADTPEEKTLAGQSVDKAIQQFNQYALKSGLTSSTAFTNLQYEISGTENRIATERKRYNEAVQKYNQKISAFPNSLIASIAGFEPKEFFQATPK